MLVVLIVIVILGVGLPLGLWLVSRRRMTVPAAGNGYELHDEIDRWLISDFNLGWRERTRVRKAVLGRQNAGPWRLEPGGPESAPLEAPLLEPARGLAARVLADGFRKLRLSRQVGWAGMGLTVVYAGYGILVLATGWGGQSADGAVILFYAGVSGVVAVYNAVLAPRRIRRNAERILRLRPA
jgi:hypothetical protein